MLGREKLGKGARELADHLMLVENVKALQQGQKEIADAISLLNDRIRAVEAELRAARAEIKLEAIRETQQMLNSVQGAFHEKLTDLTVRVAQTENQQDSHRPIISLPQSARDTRTYLKIA
jgi:hypothetical protein